MIGRIDSRGFGFSPLAALLALGWLAGSAAAQDQPVQDEFRTSGGLPGQVGGGPCEDTSKYDQQYGGPPVRIVLEALHDPLYQRHPDILARCAVDRCAVNQTAICWINEAALAEARNEPPVSDEFETGSDDAQQYDDPGYGADDYGTGGNGTGGNGTGGSGSGGGGTASQMPPDGSKSIYRQSELPPNPQITAEARKQLSAMDYCLTRAGLSYYHGPRVLERSGPVAYDERKGALTFDSNAMAGEDPYRRALSLGDAMATHVLALERKTYGDRRLPWDQRLAGDFILGYLMHCLDERKLVPLATNADDPRPKFAAWALISAPLVDNGPLAERQAAFDSGWFGLGMRMPDWLGP
jgi:hypothetical protein